MAWIEKRKTKSGTKYRVGWDIGTPEKRERRFSELFDSYEDAKNFRSQKEVELQSGAYIEPTKMTVRQYFEYWLEIRPKKLSDKTEESYRCEFKNHIGPELGDYKIKKLAPLHVQTYYKKMLEEGRVLVLKRQIAEIEKKIEATPPGQHRNRQIRRLDRAKERLETMIREGKCGLSSTTVNYHHRILHKMFQQAVKWRDLQFNICDAVEPPSPEQKEMSFLTREEISKFLESIKTSYMSGIFLTAIFTGMRRGEILGLKWQDIDFDAGIIHVRRQLQYTKTKGYNLDKEPKRNSKRDIPMPLPLNVALRAIQKKQNEFREKLEDGTVWNEHNLVFCRGDGHPWYGSVITRELHRVLDENGIKRIRFHDLRHSFATAARNSGVSIEDLQDMLGHAEINTTKKMYVHKDVKPLQRAMDRLSEYLGVPKSS